jgi:hypothetical protein
VGLVDPSRALTSFLGILIRSNEIFIRFGGKAKPCLFHF